MAMFSLAHLLVKFVCTAVFKSLHSLDLDLDSSWVLIQSFVDLEVFFGLLSCWKVDFHPYLKFYSKSLQVLHQNLLVFEAIHYSLHHD